VAGEGSEVSTCSVVETINQNASPKDLATFQKEFDLPSRKIANEIGGHNGDLICKFNPNGCAEANLDVQYTMAMAPGSAPFKDWIQAQFWATV